MALLFYFKKAWHDLAPYNPKAKPSTHTPEPEKPLWRPGFWVLFRDPQHDCGEIVGKVAFVVYDTETGKYRYEITHGYSQFDVAPTCIVGRMRLDES